MRKKYLSALLFGALLFASAGTFTSCKDYDDDINNLQEQINTIASSLEDLKTKVESMGGVKDVTFADGVLTVTTDAGSATYNIPDKVGITKVELKDGVLYVDGVEAGKAQTVEVKGGILYIDGEAQELNVNFDSNVVAVIDKAAGIYTLTVNNETIELPIAFANVKISLQNPNNYKGDVANFVFTEYYNGDYRTPATSDNQKYGIHWAIASKDFEWDGPKDAPKAGEMVVGQITAARVSVRPINFDLTTADLKLVPSVGEAAAVTVKAYPSQDNGPLNTGSRNASVTYNQVKQGDYVLTLEFDKNKTAEEMIHDFATSDNDANLKYALSVNGVIVTDYQFVIDTQLKADAQPSCQEVNGQYFAIGGVTNPSWKTVDGVKYYKLPAGKHQMSYLDGRIYDMKVEIDDSSKSDANVYGVVINEDGTISADDKAVNRDFKLKVTLIDVNGNKSKTSVIGVTFDKTDKSQVVTLDASTYKVFPNSNYFVVDLQDVFESLSDEDAISIKDANNVQWNIENNDQNFVINAFDNWEIEYYKDAALTQNVILDDNATGEAVKSIKYAKIYTEKNGIDYRNSLAKVGEHLVSVTIYAPKGVPGTEVNTQVKKVNIPVHVQLPAWNEVFTTTQQWSGDTYVARLTNLMPASGSGASASVELPMNSFAAVDNAWLTAANNIELTKLKYIDVNDQMNENDAATVAYPIQNLGTQNVSLKYDKLTDGTNTTGKLAFTEMTAAAQYTYDGYDNFIIKSGDYKVKIQSIFEGTTLTYDGGTTAVLSNDNYIDGSKLKLTLNGFSATVQDNSVTGSFLNAGLKYQGGDKTFGFSEALLGLPSNESAIYFIQKVTASGLTNLTATIDATGVKINVPNGGTINSGQGGTYTMIFTDAMGVQWTQQITFTKK